MLCELPFSRARIYAFYFPKKAFTPSRKVRCLLIFIGLECEGLDFKVFTWAAKHSHGWWTIVKGWNTKPSHRKSASKSGEKQHSCPYCCEYLKNKAFTLEVAENQEKTTAVWRGECFFEGKNTYRKIEFTGRSWQIATLLFCECTMNNEQWRLRRCECIM